MEFTRALGCLVVVFCVATGAVAGDPESECRRLAEQAAWEEALEPCRQAHGLQIQDGELARLLARAEFEAGDSGRAAQLWGARLDEEGWSEEAASARAAALWRAGETSAAEAALRDVLERTASSAAYLELIRFLLEFERWEEAAGTARRGSAAHPGDCELLELWGAAESRLGHHELAAELFRRAVEGGCPPFRWTGLGDVPERLDRPPYRDLLDADEIVRGLGDLDVERALDRLDLLEKVPHASVAPELAELARTRGDARLRLTALGLLSSLGDAAVDQWEAILADDDLILRKQALRRVREIRSPTFIPLVDDQLERETVPGNVALAQLVLGELLADAGRTGQAIAHLEAVPATEAEYAPAQLALADLAEARGDVGTAMEHLERARTAGATIDPERFDKLRRDLERR